MAFVFSQAARRYISTTVARKAGLPGQAAVAGHEGGADLWKKIFFFGGLPACFLSMVYCYLKVSEEGHKRADFVEYDYLRVHTKRFPWGEGVKGLFHNPHVNALPTGYEDDGGHH